MNHSEYAMVLGTLILLVGTVGILGQATTGLFHLDGRNTARVYQSAYGIERPVGTLGMRLGQTLAPPRAKKCEADMRYLGRNYTSYIRCCTDYCLQPCKDQEQDISNTRDCAQACARTCRDIMTNNYLRLQPGTWRY